MIAGWIARQESRLISQRTKAGIARRKTVGGHVGRKPGSKDRGRRSNADYFRNRNASSGRPAT